MRRPSFRRESRRWKAEGGKSIVPRPGALPALLALLGGILISPARADRIVLGPDGLTLSPRDLRAEFAATPYRTEQNLSWLQYALPMGLEIQTQFLDIANDRRTLYSLDAQYPFLTEFGLVPAVSVGIRDLLGTGTEHRSFYVAASKTLPLSEGQLKMAHDFRITLGVGTERMDGLFVGFHSHLKAGLFVDAEIYRRRPNISLALPLVRNLQARAYSLDGNVFYGLSYTLAR
jgi:hypothetical protein